MILEEDPLVVLDIVKEVTDDIVTDEFQILSEEAVELACMEMDREVEFI
jgi:hypothetical protein